jgi:hypothetical protein
MYRSIPVVLLLGVILTAACAPSAGRMIRIEAPGDFVQNPLWKFKNLMSELGYRPLDLLNPETGQPATVVEEYGEYRMLFSAIDDTDIKVSMRINEQSGKSKLILYREGEKDLDNRAMERYQVLRDRLVLDFGRDNVRGD